MKAESTGGLNKIDYISSKLENHMRSFDSSAFWYRRIYFWTSMGTLTISGLITVVAGWNVSSEYTAVQRHITLVLGAVATVVSGWGLFFSPKDSWLICATSLNRLRSLNSKIDFMKSLPSTVDTDQQLASEVYAEYQAIMDDHNKAWLALRSKSVVMDRQLQSYGAPR
jgi:hypothetical protein